MSLERPELARLQHWMQEVVVHFGTVEEAIESDGAENQIPSERLSEVVLPSHSMTSAERVGVYHGMYLMRMEEALETDFPVIRYHLGDHQFAHLVRDYVQRYPSTSYTLNRLGDHLPQFFLDEPERHEAAFLHDLARLELAMTEVFDEEESPVLGAAELEAVPPEMWDESRLVPVPAFRLLAFKHAVIPDLVAYHEDRPSPSPRRRATWVALYRRDYSVLRLELSRAEYDLLTSIVGGAALGEALATAAASKSPRQQAKVFRWFRTWISEGLFTAIE
ncbi:MAG: DNA-binding domain-containing protein, partial [Thermoanaerobaculales bacterium]|nr:DNA-binding domain-containing protein [Thermoanaerobaculales bacterium]